MQLIVDLAAAQLSVVVVNYLNSRYALKGEGVRRDPSMTDDTSTSIPMTTSVRTILTGMYAVKHPKLHQLRVFYLFPEI
jgi:hypothetical protein